MELTFNKVDNWYEAEFEVTDDINLHIELNVAAPIKLYQKTSGDKYDLVQAFKPSIDKVLDTDLMAIIYPKYIKVVSESEVTMGIVTFTGEGGNSGNGGGTEEDPYKYINFLSVGRDDRDVLRKYISEYSENGLIFPTVEAAEQYGDTSSPTYAKIDFNAVVSYDGTIKDMLMNNDGWTEDKIASLPYVTREEFYNLNA